MRVRVLVVDDSATMRQLVAGILSVDPAIEVVAMAGDASTARQAIKDVSPDVMTLDIEMPGMSGLEFLDKVMRLRPMPVIMVSTLTAKGSDVVIEALQAGAVDCVLKPTPTDPDSLRRLPAIIKMAVGARLRLRPVAAPHLPKPVIEGKPAAGIVAIGSSTGGVEALISVLSAFPEKCAPTVITQHMPPHFTTSLARRLDSLCAATVEEARDGAPLKVGHVYLAPGGSFHLEIAGRPQAHVCRLRSGEPVNGHRPSVDVLFGSVARFAGRQSVGVILTGMGRDGASGLLAMREAGARTIGQNEATCVVYGMPKAALENGGAARQLPLERIGAEIVSLTQSAFA